MEHDWGTMDLTVSLRGPGHEFGLRTSLRKGFMTRSSWTWQHRLWASTYISCWTMTFFSFILSSVLLSFGAHLLVIHRILQSNSLPVNPIPSGLMLAFSSSFWNLLPWRSSAGVFQGFLVGLSLFIYLFSETDHLLTPFCIFVVTSF